MGRRHGEQAMRDLEGGDVRGVSELGAEVGLEGEHLLLGGAVGGRGRPTAGGGGALGIGVASAGDGHLDGVRRGRSRRRRQRP